MSETTAGLERKIHGATDLQSVVRSMKALAASRIRQYEASALALAGYYRTVELALGVCLREGTPLSLPAPTPRPAGASVVGAVVFGSDQGLVGQFNEVVAERAAEELASTPGRAEVWAIGERVHARLADLGLRPEALFAVPTSVDAIAAMVGKILVATEAHHGHAGGSALYLFYNRALGAAGYEPVTQRLLPLDEGWRRALIAVSWPTPTLPEVVLGNGTTTLRALVREHVFVSLFRACADSLASENASRLAAMQRADKNINELLETLHGAFHSLRQGSIDEELFDVIAGFEALPK